MIPEIEAIKRYYENSCVKSKDLAINLDFCQRHKIEEVAFYQSKNETIKSKMYFNELLYIQKFGAIKSLLQKLNDLNINYAVVKGITPLFVNNSADSKNSERNKQDNVA